MSTMISPDEFVALFKTFEHSAWRLETRCGYASDRDDETYREFIETGTVQWDLDSAWCTNMRHQTSRGKRVGRVRIVDAPPTTGQLYLLDNARRNAATGEDMRNLWRADAEWLRLPAEDFWIFDSRMVALLRFDEADILLGVETITDPVEVLRRVQMRDVAVHHAIAYDDFAALLGTHR